MRIEIRSAVLVLRLEDLKAYLPVLIYWTSYRAAAFSDHCSPPWRHSLSLEYMALSPAEARAELDGLVSLGNDYRLTRALWSKVFRSVLVSSTEYHSRSCLACDIAV